VADPKKKHFPCNIQVFQNFLVQNLKFYRRHVDLLVKGVGNLSYRVVDPFSAHNVSTERNERLGWGLLPSKPATVQVLHFLTKAAHLFGFPTRYDVTDMTRYDVTEIKSICQNYCRFLFKD
jgi:hypothetical protein